MNESLRQKQSRFVLYVGELIRFAYGAGYELTAGEFYRPQATAIADATAGIGIKNSLHTLRLAVDFNLFRGGEFLTGVSDYQPLGEHWESLAPDCRWGGRFSRPDADHFSIEHEGVR